MKMLYTPTLLLIAGLAPVVFAQGNAPAPDSSDSRPAVAAARTSPIRIDGRLDEAAWNAARPAAGFVQAEPVEGAAVDQPTEVRVLFDCSI